MLTSLNINAHQICGPTWVYDPGCCCKPAWFLRTRDTWDVICGRRIVRAHHTMYKKRTHIHFHTMSEIKASSPFVGAIPPNIADALTKVMDSVHDTQNSYTALYILCVMLSVLWLVAIIHGMVMTWRVGGTIPEKVRFRSRVCAILGPVYLIILPIIDMIYSTAHTDA